MSFLFLYKHKVWEISVKIEQTRISQNRILCNLIFKHVLWFYAENNVCEIYILVAIK